MADPHATDIVAPVRGMHCAACVGKVERALTSVPGVDQASVNLATEQATVSFDPARTSVDALQAAVAAAGYELAEPRTGAGPVDDAEQSAREAEQRSQRNRLIRGSPCSPLRARRPIMPTSCRGSRRCSRIPGSSWCSRPRFSSGSAGSFIADSCTTFATGARPCRPSCRSGRARRTSSVWR